MPIGSGSEEMEAVILIDVLRRAGADVIVASVEAETEVVMSRGVRIVADCLIGECLGRDFDLIVLPVRGLDEVEAAGFDGICIHSYILNILNILNILLSNKFVSSNPQSLSILISDYPHLLQSLFLVHQLADIPTPPLLSHSITSYPQGGMPGAERLRDSLPLRELTERQARGGRLYGAMCAAPAVALHSWGLLVGKKVRCSCQITTHSCVHV